MQKIQETKESLLTKLGQAAERCAAAEASATKARLAVTELKELLHDSEMERARLAGYIERCHADEDARSEFITTSEPTPPQRMPRSQLTRQFHSRVIGTSNQVADATDYGYGSRRETTRKPHWTSK